MQLQRAYRITTFAPPEHVDTVLDAILAKDSLAYGPYDKSAWWSAIGTEQFEPRAGANPTLGKIGQTERVPTIRLEFALPRDETILNRVLDALLQAHPWQEPAVFVDETIITVSNPNVSI